MSKKADNPKKLPIGACTECWKPASLCVCRSLTPAKSKLEFLILQYPQEVKNPLGTARLLSLMVANSTHRIGLSWSSLSKALGAPAEPGAWAVLYLGSHKESRPKAASQLVNVLSKTNESIPLTKLKGVVILDGNWKQSKSLWWRNAWLKKLPRLMLFPTSPSLYGTLRREPRKNSVSTLEAAAYVIEAVEPKSALPTYLRGAMGDFVERAKRISVDTAAAPLVH